MFYNKYQIFNSNDKLLSDSGNSKNLTFQQKHKVGSILLTISLLKKV